MNFPSFEMFLPLVVCVRQTVQYTILTRIFHKKCIQVRKVKGCSCCPRSTL